MDLLISLAFSIVLLLMTFSLATKYLAGPLMVLRKLGVLKVGRWLVVKLWRGIVAIYRALMGVRRRRIRLPRARAFIRLFK